MTKNDAQGLIQVMKEIIDKGDFLLPVVNKQNNIRLCSAVSKKDTFRVIINRSGIINPNKYTLLLMYKKDQGLIRIDVNGPKHTNPDGSIVPCPHIHMQTQDTGRWDAWAEDIPAVFGSTNDIVKTVYDFLMYCKANNISEIVICEQKEL